MKNREGKIGQVPFTSLMLQKVEEMVSQEIYVTLLASKLT